MKACHKNKTKTLLLGVSKILLAVYALIKRMFESSLLESQKHVHGQAAGSGPRPGSFLLTMQLCLLYVGNSHGENEA